MFVWGDGVELPPLLLYPLDTTVDCIPTHGIQYSGGHLHSTIFFELSHRKWKFIVPKNQKYMLKPYKCIYTIYTVSSVTYTCRATISPSNYLVLYTALWKKSPSAFIVMYMGPMLLLCFSKLCHLRLSVKNRPKNWRQMKKNYHCNHSFRRDPDCHRFFDFSR